MINEIEENFKCKSRSDVDKAINRFKEFESNDQSKIRSFFFELFGLFPMNNIFLKSEGLKEMSIYRSRLFSDVKDPTQSSQFKYPPEKITKLQRVNLEKKPVFYGSDAIITSLKETKNIYPGTEFYVSEWRFKPEMLDLEKYPFFSFAMLENMAETNPWRTVLKGQQDFLNIFKDTYELNDETSDIISYWIYRLSELFIELPESKYNLSAYLGDQIIYNHPFKETKLLPLIYPSVAKEKGLCNFAFHPKFVDQYLYLSKVYRLTIKDLIDDGISIDFSKIGIPVSDTKIDWFNIELNPSKSIYIFDHIKCECGVTLDTSNAKNIQLHEGESKLSNDQIIERLKQNINLYESDAITKLLFNKELLHSFNIPITFHNTNLSFTKNDIKHSNLEIGVTIKQLVSYLPVIGD